MNSKTLCLYKGSSVLIFRIYILRSGLDKLLWQGVGEQGDSP